MYLYEGSPFDYIRVLSHTYLFYRVAQLQIIDACGRRLETSQTAKQCNISAMLHVSCAWSPC